MLDVKEAHETFNIMKRLVPLFIICVNSVIDRFMPFKGRRESIKFVEFGHDLQEADGSFLKKYELIKASLYKLYLTTHHMVKTT